MIKKIIISFLGLAILATANALINVYVLHRQSDLILPLSPLWMMAYMSYCFIMIKQYLKL